MQAELSANEVALIMAALRNWQIDTQNEDLVEAYAGHFEDHEPLTDDEIDDLCERLNFADGGQVVKGGLVTSHCQTFVWLLSFNPRGCLFRVWVGVEQ